MTLLPFVGVILYFFIGRNYRRETPLRQRILGEIEAEAAHVLSPVYESYGQFTAEAEASLVGHLGPQARGLGQTRGRHAHLPATSVELFTSGAEKFDALLDDMRRRTAPHPPHVPDLGAGRAHRQVTEVLLEKLRQGVEVRILYDFVTSLRYRKDELRLLARSGARVKPCFKRLGQINYRNHMKIALVDGEVVYTGGMNMGQEYIDGGRRFARWRDTHVRLTGPIVAPFAILFAALWRLNGGREDLAAGYLPEPGSGRDEGAVPVQVLHSSVATPFKSIRDAFIVALLEAHESVWIQTPYFVPDEPLLTAMRTAALAGTDVRLMTVGVPDKKFVLLGGASLLPADPRERRARLPVHGRVPARQDGDGRRSLVRDRHLQLGHPQPDAARGGLLRVLRRGLRPETRRGLPTRIWSLCREFTLEDWHALSGGERVRDSFVRLFSRLL